MIVSLDIEACSQREQLGRPRVHLTDSRLLEALSSGKRRRCRAEVARYRS
jgi:hypothetical protein